MMSGLLVATMAIILGGCGASNELRRPYKSEVSFHSNENETSSDSYWHGREHQDPRTVAQAEAIVRVAKGKEAKDKAEAELTRTRAALIRGSTSVDSASAFNYVKFEAGIELQRGYIRNMTSYWVKCTPRDVNDVYTIEPNGSKTNIWYPVGESLISVEAYKTQDDLRNGKRGVGATIINFSIKSALELSKKGTYFNGQAYGWRAQITPRYHYW